MVIKIDEKKRSEVSTWSGQQYYFECLKCRTIFVLTLQKKEAIGSELINCPHCDCQKPVLFGVGEKWGKNPEETEAEDETI